LGLIWFWFFRTSWLREVQPWPSESGRSGRADPPAAHGRGDGRFVVGRFIARHPRWILWFYRRELRPVIAAGAKIMDQIFSSQAQVIGDRDCATG